MSVPLCSNSERLPYPIFLIKASIAVQNKLLRKMKRKVQIRTASIFGILNGCSRKEENKYRK
jgi:hypothetical protein